MKKPTTKKKSQRVASRYGILEWYGQDVRNLDPQTRARFAQMPANSQSEPCPFMDSSFAGIPCRKKGGVCSIVQYAETEDGTQMTGTTSTLCPDRFWEGNVIIAEIAEKLLGAKSFYALREMDFLKSIGKAKEPVQAPRTRTPIELPAIEDDGEEEMAEGKAVGKIDMILVDVDDSKNWCAVEMQSVYFSGPNMDSHRLQFIEHPEILPRPDKVRRPDFRSSSSKRLLPQLQIKVPDLSRWAKKMVIIVDASFFQSMAPMKEKSDVSNADIIWFVVDYNEVTNEIYTRKIVNTTLEDAVIGLTAAEPVGQKAFEANLERAVASFNGSRPTPSLFGENFPSGNETGMPVKKAKVILVER